MRGFHKGFVLLVLLVYMQALLLFVLLSFSLVSKDYIRSSIAVKMDSMSIRAAGLLRNIERRSQPCGLVSGVSSRDLKIAPRSWWEKNACTGFDLDNRYFFIHEKVASSKLSIENNIVEQLDRYDIYRNTLLYVSAVNYTQSVMLQSVTRMESGKFLQRLTLRLLW